MFFLKTLLYIFSQICKLNKEVLKQPFNSVLRERCSENMNQIHKRTPMPECDFNKIAKQLGCSLVNLLHIFRTPFPKNTFEGLPLEVTSYMLCRGVFRTLPNI